MAVALSVPVAVESDAKVNVVWIVVFLAVCYAASTGALDPMMAMLTEMTAPPEVAAPAEAAAGGSIDAGDGDL